MDPSKILIIDDDVMILDSFTCYLEDCGFEVLTAQNGHRGLELIECEQPHLLLVDLRMPDLDGFEVLIRSEELAPDIPKIVMITYNIFRTFRN